MTTIIKSSGALGAEWNLPITRGASIGPYELTVLNKLDGDPIDLTDYTLACQIRASSSGAVVITVDFDLTDPENGVVEFSVPYSETAALTSKLYLWDCTATNSDGVERLVLWHGSLPVSPGVTR